MVNSLSGHVTKTKDGLTYGKARGSYYSAQHGYFLLPKRENRYSRYTLTNKKTAPRERAAIIMLRKKGYTYNQLATAFERSTSYIYQVCRTAMNRGTLPYRNYKTGLTHMAKIITSGRRIGMLLLRFSGWLSFIKGEVEKPP
jgi:hypothetical protein